MLDEGLSRLIADIYAGAHDRAAWDRAMDAVIQRLDAKWMMVGIFDERQKTPLAPGWHRVEDSRGGDGVVEYLADAYRSDPTNLFAAKNPAGGLFNSQLAAPPETYLEHEFVRWLQSTFGSAFWTMRYDGRDGLQLGASLHRTLEQGPLSGDESQVFALLYSHIETATRLAARPPLLDGLEPTLLIDGRGDVISISAGAAGLLGARDGIALIDGRLCATDRRSTAALDRVLRSALGAVTSGGCGGSVALERAAAAPLLATVVPLIPGDVPLPALRPQALVRLVDPAADPAEPVADWHALFGFTPAERRLARAMLTGEGSLRQVAESLGIAYATARVQLAAVFDKANVRSQVELVRLLTRLG